MNRKLALIAVLCFFAATVVRADARVTLPRTTVRHLEAKANGVAYELYVSLPRDYATSKERYPVVYVLDADYAFPIAHNVVEHLADRGDLPWAIVVGIAYAGEPQYRMHRTRDYTPTHTLDLRGVPQHQRPYQKYTGGGPKFEAFLRQELLPLIDREYRTTSRRVLVGHSYGGLFATWMLLTAPDLFSGYVVVSPSFWYDDRLLFTLEKKSAAKGRGRAYLAAGAMENPIMASDLEAMSARLRAHPNLRVRAEVPDGETHNSIFPGAFSRGIRWVLEGR